jgi:hypothetical protein
MIIAISLFLASSVLSQELDFTPRDSAGKEVKWSISKPECDVRDGAAQVMERFGLTQLKLLPMCGETVKFFEDRGTYMGTEYMLKGAEYHGPWGVRCAYAVAETLDGAMCPRDAEVALHVLGKFRYCLWGGNWMARQHYEQEICDPGTTVIIGPKALATQASLMAQGVSEADAWNQACSRPENRKSASLWSDKTVVRSVEMPESCGVQLYYLADSNMIQYAAVRPYTLKTEIVEPQIVQRSMLESELARDSSCITRRVDKSMLTESALRKAGHIKDNEKLERVIFREAECIQYDGNILDQNAPFYTIYVKKPIIIRMAKISTYPLSD